MSTQRRKNLLDAVQRGAVSDMHSLSLFQILEEARDEIANLKELKEEMEKALPEALKRPEYILDKKVEFAIEAFNEKLTEKINEIVDALSSVEKRATQIENKAGELAGTVSLKAEHELLKTTIQGLEDFSKAVSSELKTLSTLLPLTNKISSLENRISQIRVPTQQEMQQLADTQILQEIPKLGEGIRNALELLNGDERLDKKAIKGLEEELKRIESLKSGGGSYGISGGARGRVHYHDLSSLCNGSTKTFPIPLNFGIIGVFSTQFPINYRPITDWTGSGTKTLTLTAAVSAPATNQTLWLIYIK